MTTTLTIQDLIRYFADKLRQNDCKKVKDIGGKQPQFPQLVIYLGNDAANAHRAISQSLNQTWPQCQEELKFIAVEHSGGFSYSEFSCDSDQARAISEDDVREIVSSLFGIRMHFPDRSKLLVYYVLDTTGFPDQKAFQDWISAIGAVKQLICADVTGVLDMLIVLLNENLVRQKTAAQIRNYLSSFYQGNEISKTVKSVMLLSNRRNDNAILEDWDICYKIVSAAIALSNNADANVTASIFRNSILTARYAREEKPLAQIGQVVVKKLLGMLEDNIPQTDPKLMDDPGLREKLGLTKNGTFTILDQYVESDLYALLPTEEQLEFFPRKDDSMVSAMSGMSANEFNDYTMGAWNQYLSGLVNSAREQVEKDSTTRKSWCEAYRSHLIKSFRKEEILYLADHLDDVAGIMAKTRMPAQESKVLIAAREQLKYMLSNDPQLVDIFVRTLQHQGQVAMGFATAWNDLLQSRRKIFDVRDSNMVTFYERKVRNYFDRQGTGICEGYAKLHNTEELAAFLRDILDDIIESDEVFSAAFEDELECRLNEDALPTDAKQYIRKKLTGNEVHTYLQTNFYLGSPVVSSILLKTDTPLHKNLEKNLAPTTYYYNTGSSNAAEALVIYEVSAENLVSGEA